MKRHELKISPKFFEDVRINGKRFEIRKNDRDFQVGDQLVLQEWHAETERYSGRDIIVEVTYITDFPEGLRPGFVCMGIF